MGTQRVQMKGVPPGLVGSFVHYFNSFVPIAQQAGQSAVLGRLSLSIESLNGQYPPIGESVPSLLKIY